MRGAVQLFLLHGPFRYVIVDYYFVFYYSPTDFLPPLGSKVSRRKLVGAVGRFLLHGQRDCHVIFDVIGVGVH